MEEKIADELLHLITAGEFKEDEKLPSENSLAIKYNVSRMIIRKAYEKLEDMQYVCSYQGKGRYLQPRLEKINLILNGDESFTEKIKQQGYDVKTQNLGCELITDSPEIHVLLGAKKDDRVFKISRLRFINHLPVAMHISYVSESLFPMIEQEGSSITSIFNYYKSKGYEEFISHDSTLTVKIPNAEEKRRLKCSSSIPIMHVQSNCVDKKTKRILEVTTINYRSDCFSYTV